MNSLRSSGILLHITSLPSPYGIGDLGPEAYRFADFLHDAGQHLWQILPLTPITAGNTSPYASLSAFAGNIYLLSPDLLRTQGFLTDADLATIPSFPDNTVSYEQAIAFKTNVFSTIPDRFQHSQDAALHCHYADFCAQNAYWLDDYALYRACETHFQKPWNQWPPTIRDRNPAALQKIQDQLTRQITAEKILQFLFATQWHRLKDYCNDRHILVIGDLPYFVDYYSVDVWAHPDLFKLTPDKKPTVVSGVPPDYFSTTGQLWKNPIYQWSKKQTHDWWISRLGHNASLYDIIRIDHFRGFQACWEIPADQPTAEHGSWQPGPGARFFDFLYRCHPAIQLVAEDLGYITADVRELKNKFHLPGMKILQFAFFDDPTTNPYIPYNLDKNAVVYTGTHDNNTIRGWYEHDLDAPTKQRINDYTAENVTSDNVNWVFIRLAFSSVADKAVIPMQDLLGLDADARMNTPSLSTGNWRWRLDPSQLSPQLQTLLLQLTRIYDRTESIIP